MTVAELVERLADFPQAARVVTMYTSEADQEQETQELTAEDLLMYGDEVLINV